MSFVVGSLDDLLSIRVDHLPNLDRFGGELLPLVEREESQIASGCPLSCLSHVSPLALIAEVVL